MYNDVIKQVLEIPESPQHFTLSGRNPFYVFPQKKDDTAPDVFNIKAECSAARASSASVNIPLVCNQWNVILLQGIHLTADLKTKYKLFAGVNYSYEP